MVLMKSSGLAIVMVLVSVLVSSSYGVASASIASIPPPPVSGYVWVDSGTSFYSVMYQGQPYSAGVIVGAYVPSDITLDKKYDLYFYVRRDPIIIFSLIPTKVIIGVSIGVGFGLTEAGKGIFLRFSFILFDSEDWAKTYLIYLYDPPETYLVSSSPEIVYESFGNVPTDRWDGPFIGAAKVSTTPPKGTSRIVLDASPKPGYVNKPVTISGVMYGSWRRIRGVVVGASVEITTDWGLRTSAVTNDQGQFSVTTNCPSAGGTYTITATFYEDDCCYGSSASIQYQVVAKIETTLSLSCVRISYGMGLAAKFYGFLTEKSSGAPVAGKTIHLTVFGGGSGWTYAVTTNSAGYYELVYTNNGGMFNWAEARFNGDDPYLPSSSGRI